MALLCCGIDGLKRVNDSLGHAAGDALIAAVGERVVQVVGSADRVGRGNGDEFFVLVDDLDGAEVPTGLIEPDPRGRGRAGGDLRPRAAPGRVDRGRHRHRRARAATTSCTTPPPRSTPPRAGRGASGSCSTAASGPGRCAASRSRPSSAPAIANHEFELHYQPIVELSTRRTVGYEALARWRHPRHGLLLPAAFVPVAEESGLISELGTHVLDQACAFLGRDPDRARPRCS